jgi:hypothetical protein
MRPDMTLDVKPIPPDQETPGSLCRRRSSLIFGYRKPIKENIFFNLKKDIY